MRTVISKQTGKEVQVDNSGSMAFFYRDGLPAAIATGPCRARTSEDETLRCWYYADGAVVITDAENDEIVAEGVLTSYEGDKQVDYDLTITFSKDHSGWKAGTDYAFYGWENEGTSRKGDVLKTINARLVQTAYRDPRG